MTFKNLFVTGVANRKQIVVETLVYLLISNKRNTKKVKKK